eukprot:1324093-Lingulodinium_polyedra.AAC.1
MHVRELAQGCVFLHARADVQGTACTRLMRACLRACTESLRSSMHVYKAAFFHARADVQGTACTRLMHACLRACARRFSSMHMRMYTAQPAQGSCTRV